MRDSYVEVERAVDSITVGHRIREDLGDLDQLCASIEELGFLQPVTVTPDGVLICGARRLAAAKQLGMKRINVWVRSGISSALHGLLAEQQENENRKSLNALEQAKFYRELKAILTEDAVRRQRLSRFGAVSGDGGPESGQPHGRTSKQAALIITGKRSDYTLEHVLEIEDLAHADSASVELRAVAQRELEGIGADGTVDGHYARTKTAQASEMLRVLSADAKQSPAVRSEATAELAALATDGRPRDLARAAKEALARARHAQENPPAEATRKAPPSPTRYSFRSFTMTISETDFWWLHYDAADVAEKLSAEQWEQFTDWVDGALEFRDAVTLLRRPLKSAG